MTFAFKPEQASPINMNFQPYYNHANFADFFNQMVTRPPAYPPTHQQPQNPISSTKYNFYDYNHPYHQSPPNFVAAAAAQSWDNYYQYDQMMTAKNQNNHFSSSSSSSCSSKIESPFSDFDSQQQQQNLWPKDGAHFDHSPKNDQTTFVNMNSTPPIKIESPNFGAAVNETMAGDRHFLMMNKPSNAETPFAWMKNNAKTSVFASKSNILHEKIGQTKTRTKEKYRVVYTDFQKTELEKEFCFNQYIDKERKTVLTQLLSLSDRQIKIWFQNRRAKNRKLEKMNKQL